MGGTFKGLTNFQKAELLLMMALAFAIPFHWFAAQCGEVALLVCAVLKLVFDQKFKINQQQRKFIWAYVIFALTWAVYLVGMIHTQNQSDGWAQVSKKLGFLIFPVIFVISDMSYMNRKRLQAIGYSLVLGCILFFFMNLTHAIYDVVFNGATSERFFDQGLMKLYYVHHCYLSMYAGLGLMFCFVQVFGDNSRKVKIINIIAYIILVVFIILARSRAGLICMVLFFILQWVWLTFIMKKKKIGLLMGCVFLCAVASAFIVFPQSFSRITSTITNVTKEKNSDKRLVQFKGYHQVLCDNWVFGVGTGDRSDDILKGYQAYREKVIEIIGADAAATIDEVHAQCNMCPIDSLRAAVRKKSLENGYNIEVVDDYMMQYIYINYAIENNLNSHNMYFDTLISVGVIGLLLMLAYFAIPVVLWIKTRKFDMLYFSFLLMIAFNMLFESVFEVQKGIIFFCFFNVLLFYMSFVTKSVKE